METSLDVFDQKLLASIKPNTVLSWFRSRLASQLARDAIQWANVFGQFHSGTYTNQWMIIDMMKFIPNNKPQDNFLIILEEIPGTIHWADMTFNFTVIL